MTSRADEQTDARLLEYDLIVIVRVSHRPAGPVPSHVRRARLVVDSPAVAVRPQLKLVVIAGCHLDTLPTETFSDARTV